MAFTRDQLKALFADNDSGDIDAGDGRHLIDQVFDADEAAATAAAALTTRLDGTDVQVAGLSAGLTLRGTVADVASLPSAGNSDGDAYIVEADGSTHIWHGSKWTATHSTLEPRLAAVESKGTVNGQNVQAAILRTDSLEAWQNDVDNPVTLSTDHLTAAGMRHMTIGGTYRLPTTSRESAPGSGTNIEISNLSIVAIVDRGHPVINAVIVRTGTQTWDLIGEEWVGTGGKNPTVRWTLDMDPAWPDPTGIGGAPGTSFTSLVFDLRQEIGDPTVFGADTVVSKLQTLEHSLDTVSRRIADIETLEGSGHHHQNIVADLVWDVDNQGPHYLLVEDDPTKPDHIGKDLYDGNEHKVAMQWRPGFDPTHFEEPPSSGTYLNWDTDPPAVWLSKAGASFLSLVDPATGAKLTYSAIKSFIVGHSVLTIVWSEPKTRMEVHKVEHGTVHT